MTAARPLTLESVAADARTALGDSARALEHSQLAREDARLARDRALDTHHSVGEVARELANLQRLLVSTRDSLGDKIDASISDKRALAADVRRLRAEVLAMRPKLDSFAEIEPELTEEAEAIRAAHRRRRTLFKWGRRALLGFVVGAATLAGATSLGTLLDKCGGHVPKNVRQEIAP